MTDGDALLFANFRADRAREISTALLDPGFDGFPRRTFVNFSAAAGLTEYSDPLNAFMTRAVRAGEPARHARRICGASWA